MMVAGRYATAATDSCMMSGCIFSISAKKVRSYSTVHANITV